MTTGGKLTPGQFLIWAGQKLQPDVPLYNVGITFTIDAEIDRADFRRAFQRLLDLSDSLRSVITEEDGTPRQKVLDRVECEMECLDLSAEADPRAALRSWAGQRCQTLFDLEKRLFDSVLVKLGEGRFTWYLCLHHIIADGWTFSVLFRRMSDLYQQARAGRWEIRDRIPTPAECERGYWSSKEYLEAHDYWKRTLARPTEQIHFYGRQPRKRSTRMRRIARDLGAERTQRLEGAAADGRFLTNSPDVSLFNILATLLVSCVHRISGARSISVGVPYHNRRSPRLRDAVGLVMEVLPVGVPVEEDDTFLSLFSKASGEARQASQHSRYTLGNPPHAPRYDVLLNYDNAGFGDFAGVPVDVDWIHTGHENYSLGLHVRRRLTGGITLEFDFHADVFTEGQCNETVGCFLRLLDAFLEDPSVPLAGVSLLDDDERQRVLALGRGRRATRPEVTLTQLFEAQAERAPDQKAVSLEDRSLTYAQLNERANRLAHRLRSLGVGPGVTVALCLERSPELIAALLGVLKAGGAYVPLDPSYPDKRLAFMIDDSHARVLVTDEELAGRLPERGLPVVRLSADWDALAREAAENPAQQASPENLVYIVYTSGSTGSPKGVEVTHRALVNYVQTVCEELALGPADRILQFASASFDTSAEEIFSCLASGATLMLRTESMLDSISVFVGKCAEWRVTVLDLPTAFWHELCVALSTELLQLPETLRVVYIGGEKARPDRLSAWRERTGSRVRLVNGYGPTEATVVSTMCDLSNRPEALEGEAPIGRPIPNVEIHLLDRHLNPVPIGIPAEIYIGGIGLARGYLNQPALTAAKFIPSPFDAEPGARLYRTGDLGRHLPDGTIEFLGRMDSQVKIRGFRVEPGEVEAQLGAHPAVREAVVVPRQDASGETRLAAFVVPMSSPGPTTQELRDFLRQRLPKHMWPSSFIRIDSLPLTAGGKVDRHALATLDCTPAEVAAQVGPQTPVEQTLAEIWVHTLGVARVDARDDFFELGGDSLLAIQVVSRLRQVFQVELNPCSFYQRSTLAGLASLIEHSQREKRA